MVSGAFYNSDHTLDILARGLSHKALRSVGVSCSVGGAK